MKLKYLLTSLLLLIPTSVGATTLDDIKEIAYTVGVNEEVVLATYLESGNQLDYNDLMDKTKELSQEKGKDSIEKYIYLDESTMDKRVSYLNQALHILSQEPQSLLDCGWVVNRERLGGSPLRITSQYSFRDNGEMHRALDFGVKEFMGENGNMGELNLYPVKDARVVRIEHNPSTSTGLAVWYEFKVGNSTYQVVYMHMNAIYVKVGDIVTKDTPLGVVGSTGGAQGLHLHMQVEQDGKRINPLRLWGYDPTAPYEERLQWFYDNNLAIVCGEECTESMNYYTDDEEFSVMPCKIHRNEG